jgi:hypothetical protein
MKRTPNGGSLYNRIIANFPGSDVLPISVSEALEDAYKLDEDAPNYIRLMQWALTEVAVMGKITKRTEDSIKAIIS